MPVTRTNLGALAYNARNSEKCTQVEKKTNIVPAPILSMLYVNTKIAPLKNVKCRNPTIWFCFTKICLSEYELATCSIEVILFTRSTNALVLASMFYIVFFSFALCYRGRLISPFPCKFSLCTGNWVAPVHPQVLEIHFSADTNTFETPTISARLSHAPGCIHHWHAHDIQVLCQLNFVQH